jgi:cysteine-rich repeat protein
MKQLAVQLRGTDLSFPAELVATGAGARMSFTAARATDGVHLWLVGERDYHVRLTAPTAQARAALTVQIGKKLQLHFAGRSTAVRRVLSAVAGQDPAPQDAGSPDTPVAAPPRALDLTAAVFGAPPLFLLADGTLSASADGPAPRGLDALPVLVTAARWVSTRRTTTFECLFPASPFHPEDPLRSERLHPAQAQNLLAQLDAVLTAAAVGTAGVDPIDAAQLRSAALTVLSHMLATVLHDPGYREIADQAAARIFRLIDAETGPDARAELRAHAVFLLSMRGPALSPTDAARAAELLRGLRRAAPPYAELTGPWRFVLNSAAEFFVGETKILASKYKFTKIATPADAPRPASTWQQYQVLKAPFQGPAGQDILVFARSASPRDENAEMAEPYFTGVIISRHANLGAFDMKAATVQVQQVGYKLMMNAQCAGLTTRFAISRMFPDADIYSSWDSTYFSTGANDEVVASEGIDCFIALLKGMAAGEDFAAIDGRLRKAQWRHPQDRTPGFVQFIGPAHPLVVSRYDDINRDGKADYYDGFLDFRVVEIAEAIRDSGTPRDPGVAASQIGGAAAHGLGWAAGSLNRVTQYSELWDSFPGQTENFYLFRAAGFYSPVDPPRDVPVGKGPAVDLGRAPAVVRYIEDATSKDGLSAEVMVHAWLSHSAQELKRLLVAADAYWRALDLGYLGEPPLDTLAGQRAGLLLLLAGLLEFPADPNLLDGLWEQALDMLRLPRLSRSLVRRCIDDEDHGNSNYYGSVRGVAALIGTADEPGGALREASPVAYDELAGDNLEIGRARPLELAQPASAPAAPASPPTPRVIGWRPMSARLHLLAVSLTTVVLAACGDDDAGSGSATDSGGSSTGAPGTTTTTTDDTPTTSGATQGPVCEPGATQDCTCPQGQPGTQTCDGTDFGPCMCAGSVCGDGMLGGAEICDDGSNDGAYGGCLADCSGPGPRCGDGQVNGPEPCDDGDDADADGCNSDCVISGSQLWTRGYTGEDAGNARARGGRRRPRGQRDHRRRGVRRRAKTQTSGPASTARPATSCGRGPGRATATATTSPTPSRGPRTATS